jgi:hypothetical protein
MEQVACMRVRMCTTHQFLGHFAPVNKQYDSTYLPEILLFTLVVSGPVLAMISANIGRCSWCLNR